MQTERRFETPTQAIARLDRRLSDLWSTVSARLVGHTYAGPLGLLDYAQSVTPQGSITTEVDVTGLSVTVDVAANRYIRILGYVRLHSTVIGDRFIVDVKESTTYIGKCGDHYLDTTAVSPLFYGGPILVAPSAGAHTYRLTVRRISGTGVGVTDANVFSPDYILVEDIGPA